MLYIALAIVVAAIGNYVIRRYVAKCDREAMLNASDMHHAIQPNASSCNKSVSEIIRLWGKLAPKSIPILEPIHLDIKNIVGHYCYIGPDELFRPINSEYANVPFVENNNYVQIGCWGDGSDILARRDVDDPAIYIASLEDAMPGNPQRFANDISEYLRIAWIYNEDSLRYNVKPT